MDQAAGQEAIFILKTYPLKNSRAFQKGIAFFFQEFSVSDNVMLPHMGQNPHASCGAGCLGRC